jgi:stage II sporulation protein AA (anti-sigma F factor antagonist)
MEKTKDTLLFSSDGITLTASLMGEIDHHAAKPIRESIDSELYIQRPEVLRLDFSGVRFMDSSAIALIIGRAELARSIGCRVRVTGLSATKERLVRLSGIARLEGVSVENMEVKK